MLQLFHQLHQPAVAVVEEDQNLLHLLEMVNLEDLVVDQLTVQVQLPLTLMLDQVILLLLVLHKGIMVVKETLNLLHTVEVEVEVLLLQVVMDQTLPQEMVVQV